MITVKNYIEETAPVDFRTANDALKKGHQFTMENIDLYGEDADIDKAIDLHIKSLNRFFDYSKADKEDKEKKAKPEKETKGIRDEFHPVKEVSITDIHTRPGEFQNRSEKYSQATVDKIVSEGFDKAKSPIKVWKDPADDKYYVLSGHSRFHAAKTLFEDGDKKLAKLPVMEYKGTYDDAKDYATIKSNRQSNKEGLAGDVRAYIRAAKRGYNKKELLKWFNPESYLSELRALSYLNPKGKFMQYLDSPEANSFPYLKRNAIWVGQLKQNLPNLTDAHETEMFNYLYTQGTDALRLKHDAFFNLIDKKVNRINFNPEEALNLQKQASTSAALNPAIEHLKQLQADIETRSARIGKLQELIARAKSENVGHSKIPEFKKEISAQSETIIRLHEQLKKAEHDLAKLDRNTMFDLFNPDEAAPILTNEKPVKKKIERPDKVSDKTKKLKESNRLKAVTNDPHIFKLWKEFADKYPKDRSMPLYDKWGKEKGLDAGVINELYDFNSFATQQNLATVYDAESLAELKRIIKEDKAEIEKTKPEREAFVKKYIKNSEVKPKEKTLNEKRYSAIFGDYDGDGILNVDDPNPTKKGDQETVEEVKLSDEIAALIDFRKEYDGKRKEFVDILSKSLGADEATILSRTKTPFSIINKLRRKRLTGKNGITDIVGTMVVFSTQKELDEFKDKVNSGALGKVLVFDDYYKNPLAGYKAYHWNIVHEGIPVELQAKTERMKKIASANHTLYKTGQGDENSLAELTDLMEKADNGNAEAQKEIDELISNEANLTERLKKKGAPAKVEKEPAPQKSAKVEKKEEKAPEPKVNHQEEMKGLLAKVQNYSGEMSREKVLQLAQEFEKLRSATSQKRDEKGDSKKRLSPTRENLARWMNNPGSFDLIGVDTYKAGDATSDLKIKKEVFWNRFGLKHKK